MSTSDTPSDPSLPSVAEARVRELEAAVEALFAITPEDTHAAG